MDITLPCNRYYAGLVYEYACTLSDLLEESSKIVKLVSVEFKVLFHPRYVCIGL
jgi:hypothetical protein